MNKKMTALLLFSMLFASCSSVVKNEISEDKKKVKNVQSRSAMIERTKGILANSPNLNSKQKILFIKLHSRAISKVKKSSLELRKLKVVLMHEMTAKDYKNAKVDELVKQIRKLHNKKLDIMLEAMKEAKNILGVNAMREIKEAWNEDHYRL